VDWNGASPAGRVTATVHAGSGLGYYFGGSDLQMRRYGAGRSLLAWIVGCGCNDLKRCRWVAEAVHARLGGKGDATVGYGRRAEQLGRAVGDTGTRFRMNPRGRHFSQIRAGELLIVDAVYSTGLNVKAVIDRLAKRTRRTKAR